MLTMCLPARAAVLFGEPEIFAQGKFHPRLGFSISTPVCVVTGTPVAPAVAEAGSVRAPCLPALPARAAVVFGEIPLFAQGPFHPRLGFSISTPPSVVTGTPVPAVAEAGSVHARKQPSTSCIVVVAVIVVGVVVVASSWRGCCLVTTQACAHTKESMALGVWTKEHSRPPMLIL
jgi:hypothetical protein